MATRGRKSNPAKLPGRPSDAPDEDESDWRDRDRYASGVTKARVPIFSDDALSRILDQLPSGARESGQQAFARGAYAFHGVDFRWLLDGIADELIAATEQPRLFSHAEFAKMLETARNQAARLLHTLWQLKSGIRSRLPAFDHAQTASDELEAIADRSQQAAALAKLTPGKGRGHPSSQHQRDTLSHLCNLFFSLTLIPPAGTQRNESLEEAAEAISALSDLCRKFVETFVKELRKVHREAVDGIPPSTIQRVVAEWDTREKKFGKNHEL